MTWTYNPTIPTDKDAVRFATGDVDTTDQLMTDEAIEYLLATDGGAINPSTGRYTSTGILYASAAGMRKIAALFSRQTDRFVGLRRIYASRLHQHFLALADALELQANERAPMGFGAPDIADTDTYFHTPRPPRNPQPSYADGDWPHSGFVYEAPL